ncbi:Hypothetical predicted protein [Olea europaea subsp. europaea]|uniref:DUF1985 domain-containing protein n=1 Tax=Olea europaea subsp. europaea TaxID=158383 RepID=A0A8S0RX32_OLEEU|nr:Hypothetical predicted protein [Olea europaea subsp. europaea]
MERSFDYVIPIEHRIKGRPSQKSFLQKLDYVREILDDVHQEMLMESCFGHLYQMKRIPFSAQLVHQIVLRMIVTKKQNDIWFSIGGKPTRFSLYEFSLIKGLRASEEPSLELHIVTNDRLVKKHFKKYKKVITVYNLKEVIKSQSAYGRQIWAYEAIPSIGWRYGENLHEADLLRICRWNSSEIPNSKDIGASLDEPNIVVHCTLKPTPEEASKAYWMEIHRFEDEVEDPTVDVFVDKENVANSSIRDDFP